MSIEDGIAKLVYENDAKTLKKELSGMPYNSLELIKRSCYKLKEKTDSVSQFGISRSGRLPSSDLRLIHIAAYYDSTETFFFLIDFLKKSGETEKDILYLKSAGDYYPLHYAIINKSYEIAMYIVNQVPEQIIKIENGLDYYPITLAVFSGMTGFIDFILKKPYGIVIEEEQIDQAYKYALTLGEYPCLKILIEYKLKNKVQNSNMEHMPETIQMKAASYCSPRVVKLVLENEKEDLAKMFTHGNITDCLLRRLMETQPPKFKEQIIYLLPLIEGEKIEPDKGRQIMGVCHWICYFCDAEIAQKLLEDFDFDVNRIDINYQTGPFRMIRDNLNEKDIINVLRLLIEHDFNINYVPMVENVLKQKTLLEFFVS